MRAKLTAASVYVDCPQCGQGLESSSTGSFLWDAADLRSQSRKPYLCTCGCLVRIISPRWLNDR